MEEKIKQIINNLINNSKTISTMESCTGGGLVNTITNIERASEVIKFSAVTYSNEYKIKMGVAEDIINKFSVYSIETAIEMSKNISKFTNSNYGIGITGKLNRQDINNKSGKDNVVYISIYDKDNNKYYNKEVVVSKKLRKENKEYLINIILDMLIEII